MRILDWYILKRYLVTFLFTMLIFIPIAVVIDISQRIDKFLMHADLGVMQIIDEYYKNFIIYYANTFMPLALFIAVILFTSKLSSNTEIVAMTNARISFTRFMLPYFIGATMITILALMMNHFVVPNSSKIRREFEKEYFKRNKNYADNIVNNFSLQLNDSTYMYLKSYSFKSKEGRYFAIENYRGIDLVQKLTADRIKWKEKDSVFNLVKYQLRKIGKEKDSIYKGFNLDTTFTFTPKDFLFKSTLAQEMPSDELMSFIDISRKRGVKNLNAYLVELHKRTSLPISSYILTIIAVALAFKKKRGGIGVNLALGFGIMFLYVFFLKIAEVLGAVAGANSLVYVWIPNIVFGFIAFYFYRNARK